MSDGKFVACNWCGRGRACQEAMGLSPGGGYMIAGFACDPCRGSYNLSFIRDPGVKNEKPTITVMNKQMPVFG